MSAPVKPASPPKTARPTMQLHPLASSSKQTVEHQEQTLTYRHVLSDSALTPLNPLRVICLIDIDAAYAQFEMARLGIDRSLPVGVQQWSSLIAVRPALPCYGLG
jgi:DNA polymerase eta